MDDDERKELGQRVAAARIRMGLGKEGAARDAHVSSITWKKVEDGKSVLDVNLAAVLRVVGLDRPAAPTVAPELHQIDDVLLLAEIARRFARGANQRTGESDAQRAAPNTRAVGGPDGIARTSGTGLDPAPGEQGQPGATGPRRKGRGGRG